jgi:transcription elongation factor Elf1
MSDIICLFCNKSYNKKTTLDKHLSSNSCKASILNNQMELHNFIMNYAKTVNNYKECTITDNSITNNINNTINIKIELQPVSDLNKILSNDEAIYNLIEKYDDIKKLKNDEQFKNVKDVKFLLSDYLKTNLCDESKPENHCIKFVSKNPPSYSITEKKDIDGEIITVIRGLKDSVDLLSDPVLNALKKTLNKFERTIKLENKKEEETREYITKYDYAMYDTTIKALKNELNKKNVQNALKQFLKHEILNDINMKIKITSETENQKEIDN